jgi:eukaryotic-like serine/threonine-protein kinase
MMLTTDAKLGHYRIIGPLSTKGSGGAYRALDTLLRRTIVIRVLPESLTESPEGRERVVREARTIAELNHPHICTLYEISHEQGIDFLVMEYLEGETLAQRLTKGPIRLPEALRIGMAVANALAKAHKLGIVHRALTPANIMLTQSGAKILNFGLGNVHPGSSVGPAGARGPILGHEAAAEAVRYMAPEQLRGEEADARTDIFSLGQVLYEMATGEPAFAGENRTILTTAILTREPPSISQLLPQIPIELATVVKKCLAKDTEERWQNASDLASELQWAAADIPAEPPATGTRHRKYRERIALALATLAFLAAMAMALTHWPGRQPDRVLSAQIFKPDNLQFNFLGDESGPPVISPDGRYLVFSAIEGGNRRRLYLRSLDSYPIQSLAGTEDATAPFWSPDSRSIAFFANGKLKRLEIEGGPPVTICDAPDARGGSWSRNGTIVFAPTFTSGLVQVPASGGTPTEVVKLDSSKYTTYRWPWFLPDGDHFLYLAANHMLPTSADTGIFLASLNGHENRFLRPSLSNAIYVSGYVLFLRGNSLMAQPFDASAGKLDGNPTVVHDGVQFDLNLWRGVYTASEDGTLMYQSGVGTAARALAWFDRAGKQLGTVGGRDAYELVQLSHDGKRMAYSTGQQLGAIWIYDLGQDDFAPGLKTRVTFKEEGYTGFAWSPDGKQLAYSASPEALVASAILTSTLSGGDHGKELLGPKSGVAQSVCDWSPDGRNLIYLSGNVAAGAQLDLWLLPLFGDKKPIPYSTVPGDKVDAQFSPDGRWIAYSSRETKRYEVFVAPFPWTGVKYQISTNGGRHPRWRGDGKELFFQVPGGTQIMSAAVNGSATRFEVGKIGTLFALDVPDSSQLGEGYAVSRDGQRFLAITTGGESSMPLTLVSNWTLELKNN